MKFYIVNNCEETHISLCYVIIVEIIPAADLLPKRGNCEGYFNCSFVIALLYVMLTQYDGCVP